MPALQGTATIAGERARAKGIENMSETKEEGRKSKKNSGEPRLRDLRRTALRAMSPKVKEIAQKLADLAAEGNCQAAKLVFEFLGIFPGSQTGEDDQDDTLARYLLRELGIPDRPSEEEITKVLNQSSQANAGAVESS